MERESTRFRPDIRHDDPFPELSHARQHLWGFLDIWAFRRLRRLGVPTPWTAWEKGYQQAMLDTQLAWPERSVNKDVTPVTLGTRK